MVTQNDVKAGRLSADVDAPAPVRSGVSAGVGTVLAAVAAPQGPGGDYTATSLSQSATWQVSAQSGDFAWSYPIKVPPGVNGPVPQVALNYDSGSVDGRTGETNNQPSSIGEGWDYSPGFIERRYQSCKDAGGGAGSADGDQCWDIDNATMTLNGKASVLVKDDKTGGWRPQHDDGSRIEHLTGAPNGANGGEYWRVTTPDGTQYYFGQNHLPGYGTSGQTTPATNSTWTVPVYGPKAGEPCSGTWCQQAWRWNLDYVVDPHNNAMSFYYTPETNYYKRAKTTSTIYTRGGYLNEIDYGQHVVNKSIYSAAAPARVLFKTDERCDTSNGFTCSDANFTGLNAGRWPDVPVTSNCKSTDACTSNISPTFWTRRWLTSISTQVNSSSGYTPVDTWLLRHSFRAPGDINSPEAWLEGITHTGQVGGSVSLPEVTFDGKPMPNRVYASTDPSPPMNKIRITKITSEAGSQINVGYSPTECVSGSTPAPQTDNKRCFQQYWTRDGGTTQTADWFHKYVVAGVSVVDLTGASATTETQYAYKDTPAWHYNDDPLTLKKYRTWSQWRGYTQVEVTQGRTDGADGTRTSTDYTYMRGMNGDRADPVDATKLKSASVKDSEGHLTPDDNELEGFTREQITTNGPGGAEVAGVINDPWTNGPTATQGTVQAWMVLTAKVRSRTDLDGGRGYRRTEVDTTYNSNGLPTLVNDLGDVQKASDPLCTRYTYAPNTDAWLIQYPSRIEVATGACPSDAAARPNLGTPETVVSDAETAYDGQGFGTAPVHGDQTKTQKLSSWVDGSDPNYVTVGTNVFDDYGRVVSSADKDGHTTSTVYTPAEGGPLTRTVLTGVKVGGQAGFVTTTDYQPAWEVATDTVDTNGKRTDLTYDPLGQLAGVWLPGHPKASNPVPNKAFSYTVSNSSPSSVATTSLVHSGTGTTTMTSYQIYDSSYRLRQTQSPAPNGGRDVADTIYDSRGLAVKANATYYNADSAPSGSLVGVTDTNVPGQTLTTYDGAGRPTASIFRVQGTEKWRTTSTYGGDRVTVVPPQGANPITTVTDARGHTIMKAQYWSANTTTGGADNTGYTYTPEGKLSAVTDPAGNVWSYHYDQMGRLTESDDPDKGASYYTYNDLSLLASVQDARKDVIAFTYDELGRKTGEYSGSTSGTQLAGWTYDTVPNGKGQLATTTRYTNGVGGPAYKKAITGYDDTYKATSATLTIPKVGNPAEDALAGTYEADQTYNPEDGSLATETSPAAGGLPAETVSHYYGSTGMPASTTGVTPYVQKSLYDNDGSALEYDYGQSQTGLLTYQNYSYEYGTKRLQETTLSRDSATNPDADTFYTHDNVGDVTEINDKPTGQAPDDQCFTYDYLRRVSSAWTTTGACSAGPSATVVGGPNPYSRSYTYDGDGTGHSSVGNRTAETDSLNGTTTQYTYPPAGSSQPHTLTATTATGPNGNVTQTNATYDADGNTLTSGPQTFDWDTEGHLDKVTDNSTAPATTTTYACDADGNRIIRHDPTGATLYLGSMELHSDNSGNPANNTATRYYTHGGATFAVRTTTGGLSWLAADDQGTADQTVATDSAQTITQRHFTLFGEPLDNPPTWPGDKGFVGGTTDKSTGLTDLGARYYNPSTGRFISADPILDISRPQQINGYSYSENNPATLSDPSGLLDPECSRHGICYSPHPGSGDSGQVNITYEGGSDDGGSTTSGGGCSWGFMCGAIRVVHILHQPIAILVAGAAEIGCNVAADGETAGAGVVPCTVLAGGLYGDLNNGLDPNGDHTILGAAKATITGAAVSMAFSAAGQVVSAAADAIPKGYLFDLLRSAAHSGEEDPAVPAPRPNADANCFPAGTKVATEHGLKSIEKIRIGDHIWSRDSRTGKRLLERVTALFKRKTNSLVTVVAAGVSMNLTPGHRVWVQGRGWMAASDLHAGDRLLEQDGRTATIGSVATRTIGTVVYNLEVAVTHTYFVTAARILVHNSCTLPNNRPIGQQRIEMNAAAKRGVSPVTLHEGSGMNGLKAAIGNESDFKWAVVPSEGSGGEFRVMPANAGGGAGDWPRVELAHTVLAGIGGRVYSAGSGTMYDGFPVMINEASGHFMPEVGRLQIGVDAFEWAGIDVQAIPMGFSG